MKTRILLFAMLVVAAFNSNAQMLCNAAFSYTVSPSGVVTFYSNSTTINSTQSFTWSFGIRVQHGQRMALDLRNQAEGERNRGFADKTGPLVQFHHVLGAERRVLAECKELIP